LQVAGGSLATESAKALAAVMKSKVVKSELEKIGCVKGRGGEKGK